MSSVGVFRKVEIDGKSFLVYTLTQTDNPTLNSGGDVLSFQPLFFCPRARIKFLKFKLNEHDDDDDDEDGDDDDNDEDDDDDDENEDDKEDGDDEDEDGDDDDDKEDVDGDDDDDDGGDHDENNDDKKDVDGDDDLLHLFNSSPHFPSTRSGDQQGESLLDCDHDGVCKLPVVPLFWCNNKESHSGEFECGGCETEMLSTSYFVCLQCQRKFHKECVESPLEIKHPSHPFHSLQLYSLVGSSVGHCICCEEYFSEMFYHCTTCDLSMHPVCAMRPIPFVVDNPKSHPHLLTFFPTQASTVCNICAQIKKLDPTYICIQCVFVIHEGCMGFPHVIRISRHHHRISFTSSLPSGMLSCGVCRQQVDNNYGAYSCKTCDSYFVHSKCALNPKVWDGKELEQVSEEDDKIDDGEPFERIADGIIRHPFHNHHLRLEIFRAYDENKYCRGCALPIYEGQFYSCMECDFVLHESCANAPRMKRYPLHPHPLTLKVATMIPDDDTGVVRCSECGRDGNGFFYEYCKEGETFQLDLRCASIIEPFEYQGHKHPLFLPWETEKETPCQMCKHENKDSKLICTECDYTICFHCASFPYKARYKHDSHFLTICDVKEASDQPEWCEVCEGKIEEVKERVYRGNVKFTEIGFYKCNDCSTALHVECLLGIDMYMKPGQTEKDYFSFNQYSFIDQNFDWVDFQVLLNSSLSRPICGECMRRCPFPIYFKGPRTILCSVNCVMEMCRDD